MGTLAVVNAVPRERIDHSRSWCSQFPCCSAWYAEKETEMAILATSTHFKTTYLDWSPFILAMHHLGRQVGPGHILCSYNKFSTRSDSCRNFNIPLQRHCGCIGSCSDLPFALITAFGGMLGHSAITEHPQLNGREIRGITGQSWMKLKFCNVTNCFLGLEIYQVHLHSNLNSTYSLSAICFDVGHM